MSAAEHTEERSYILAILSPTIEDESSREMTYVVLVIDLAAIRKEKRDISDLPSHPKTRTSAS